MRLTRTLHPPVAVAAASVAVAAASVAAAAASVVEEPQVIGINASNPTICIHKRSEFMAYQVRNSSRHHRLA